MNPVIPVFLVVKGWVFFVKHDGILRATLLNIITNIVYSA